MERPGDNGAHDHAAALYASDAELLDLVLPFVRAGLEAGEPTVLAMRDQATATVLEALGEEGRRQVVVRPAETQLRRPATTIASFRALFDSLVRPEAPRFRVVAAIPHPGTGHVWDGWARYEAADAAYDGWDVRTLCAYDTRLVPPDVLDEVVRVHRTLAIADGPPRPNGRYEPAEAFLAGRAAPPVEPVEQATPTASAVDPTAREARRIVKEVAAAALDVEALDDLVLAVSEVVANAALHGAAPIDLRVWVEPDRVVVNVTDGGAGPTDPLVGLLPTGRDGGGLGLWLANQLCARVELVHAPGAFTVRLVSEA